MPNQADTQEVKPNYYGGYATLDFIEKFKLNFSRGSVIKYVVRAGHKDNELVDLEKARTYLDREIERIKREKEVT